MLDKDKASRSKKLWTPEEDSKLCSLVSSSADVNWDTVATEMVSRSKKDCNERWLKLNHKEKKRGKWTAEEDAKILSLVEEFGWRWLVISQYFPGRNENAIKNRFHLRLKPKLLSTDSKSSQDKNRFDDDCDTISIDSEPEAPPAKRSAVSRPSPSPPHSTTTNGLVQNDKSTLSNQDIPRYDYEALPPISSLLCDIDFQIGLSPLLTSPPFRGF